MILELVQAEPFAPIHVRLRDAVHSDCDDSATA